MDTLQHVAAHCITLHHIASRCNTLQQYLIKFVFGHSAAVVNIELLKSLGKTLHKNSQKSALKSFYMQNLVAHRRLLHHCIERWGAGVEYHFQEIS